MPVLLMPVLHLPRSPTDFLDLGFSQRFVRHCSDHVPTSVVTVHIGIVRFFALALVDVLGLNHTEIVRNRRVSTYFKWRSYGASRCPYSVPRTSDQAIAVSLRPSYAFCPQIIIQKSCGYRRVSVRRPCGATTTCLRPTL